MSEDRMDLSGAEDFIDDVKEIDMTFRDHRADDDFERMLAELNGKKPAERPAVPEIEPEDDSIAAAMAANAARKAAEEQARRDAEERAKREAAAEKARREAEEAAKRDAAARRAKAEAEGKKPVKKRRPAPADAAGQKPAKVQAGKKPAPRQKTEQPGPEKAAAKKVKAEAPKEEVKTVKAAPAEKAEVKDKPKAEKPGTEKPAPKAETPAPAEKPVKKAEAVSEEKPAPEKAEAKPKTEEKQEQSAAETRTLPSVEEIEKMEAAKAAETASEPVEVPVSGVKMGGALAVSGASQKKRRKTAPAKTEEPELTEAEQKELKRKAEDAHRHEMERLEKEREQRLIESIANIWQSPDFSAGGRVEMNIKTEQRKVMHITVPNDLEERRKARELAEVAKADAQRRNTEEEARIAAAAAAIEKMEEPEIPPEMLKPKAEQPAKPQAEEKPQQVSQQTSEPAPKPKAKVKRAKTKPVKAASSAAAATAGTAAKAAATTAKAAADTAKTAVSAKAAADTAKTAAAVKAVDDATKVMTKVAPPKAKKSSKPAAASARKPEPEADNEATRVIDPKKVRDTAAISRAISAAAAEAVDMEDLTREMSAVIPQEKKETPEERRLRREAAEAALAAKESESKPKAKKEKKKDKKSGKKASKDAVPTLSGKYAIGNIVACCAIFFGLGVFLVVCKRESGFIQSENRNLAEKPKLSISAVLDGSYFEDITTWYTDTIPGREQLKPFSSGFEKLFGVTFNNVKITGDMTPVKKETLDPDLEVTTTTVTLNTNFTKKSDADSGADSSSGAETTKKTTKKKKQTSEELADVPPELDDGAWIGNVVVSGKGKSVRAMSAFYGQFSMGEKYAETINKYREDLGSGINIYTMNMPSSSAYYMPKNLADSFTSQQDCITNIGNNLAGVINVDTYPILESHKDEYIYSRTDHHWQPLGAYYAAKAFSVMGSFDCPDLDTYEEFKIEDFVGTMYAYSNYDEELAKNPDTFIYHKPDNVDYLTVTNYDRSFQNGVASQLFFDYASGVNCYSAILGTDDQITEIETGENTGRTLVVIKDSFGNALIPYLTHGFDKIYVIDFRYFNLNAIDFIQDVEATDLLFAVSLAAAHTESHINAIGNLRIQTGGSSTSDEDLPEVVVPDAVVPDDNGGGDTDGGEE